MMMIFKFLVLVLSVFWCSNEVYAAANKAVRQKRSDDSGPLETIVMQQAQRITTLEATVQTLKPSGSTFVRWGKAQCPGGTTTIYSGYGAGGNAQHTGTGANRVCMVPNPVSDNTPLMPNGHGTIYGAQYYLSSHTSFTDVLCAFCHTPFSSTFMVPGTNRCPNGTTEQYHGYLSVGNHASIASSEYLCLDSNPDDRPGTNSNDDCAWFEHAGIVCGALPCPPYVSGRAATCAVCSM